jgi:hypothetical protein
MKKLLILVVLLAVGIAAFGYHQGWFTVEKETNSDGKTGVTVTVDKDKIHQDTEHAKDKAKELGGKVKDSASEIGQKVK